MTIAKRFRPDLGYTAALIVASLFFAACTWASYAHWSNFEYRTFDLAYYIQAVWQLIHGRFDVSIAGVPLLGNHVEPIVVMITPFYLVLRHPMTFVVFQNIALAAMGPLAYGMARRTGSDRVSALLLSTALLLTPATGYVAIHEFHPEALTAPFLLFMIDARLRHSLRAHWSWAIALLACKENMALLVAAYCLVHAILERKRPFAELMAWNGCLFLVAILWFLACAKIITPALNSGAIDYLALYDRLGSSPGDILLKAVTEPQRIIGALSHSLGRGNLIWALLLPFLGLSLLRPQWLLIGAPILLQHLLSWRSSEWQIYFHYGAPLIPLFWIALVEAIASVAQRENIPRWATQTLPILVVVACATAQILLGPARSIVATVVEWPSAAAERARKTAFVNQISPTASVVAPLAYLSHLATREKIYSLHYVLKGLKTLSRSTYEPPPPTDFVLIDYQDSSTFDAGAGFYHPAMKTVDGRIVPSSDRLLHDFLKQSTWFSYSSNEIALLRRAPPRVETQRPEPQATGANQFDAYSVLTTVTKSSDTLSDAGTEITLDWNFTAERESFPWMFLKLTPRDGGAAITIAKGLCAPEIPGGAHRETWRIVPTTRIQPGDYEAEGIFVDYPKVLWSEKTGRHTSDSGSNFMRVPLGTLKVTSSRTSGN